MSRRFASKARARPPVDTSCGVRPTPQEFADARRIVGPAVEALIPLVDSHIGRPRSLSVEGLLVAMVVTTSRAHHRVAVVEFAKTLNAFSPSQLEAVGIRDWNEVEAYDRVDRLFNKVTKAMEGSSESQAIADLLIDGSLHDLRVRSRSVAVDGTDVETWASLRGDLADDDVDTEYDKSEASGTRVQTKVRRGARVLGVGEDGRKIYTADRDARAGHRSAVNSRGSGYYIGYEAHLAVQVREVKSSNGIDQVSFGPDVPPVITAFALAAAGTHRGVVVPRLLDLQRRGFGINEVIWDRGYSQLRPETTAHPLHRAGVDQTFRPKDPQRKLLPYSTDAVLIEGQLFSAHVPEDSRDLLPMPPIGSSEDVLEQYERPFNQRARFRYQRHARPDADGVSRWKCPFHAGRLRSRQLPWTMRRSRTAPLVELPDGARCCDGTKSVSAADLPLWQRLAPGTTAWRKSFGRRQVVEGANAGLKGGFVNIERKFCRVLGLTKMTLLLACTIAGYNRNRIRAFLSRQEFQAQAPKKRAKRRRGTFSDILGAQTDVSGRGPPTGRAPTI